MVSGPSGAGKTSVMQRVFQACRVPLVRSISATTRPPRSGEIDGVDYHFLSNEEFQSLRQRGDFLESFQVFTQGHWYGTRRLGVATGLAAGKWVVLEIDVQGAQAVTKRFPDAVTIFLRPSSQEELERRLRGRGTESEEAIRRRLARAERELALADRYQYQVINDNMDQAVQEICAHSNHRMGEEPTMIEELREEEIVKKIGGRFKLSTLIQKRLVQLNGGARPLVDRQERQQNADRHQRDHARQDFSRHRDERAGGGRRRSRPAADLDFRNL